MNSKPAHSSAVGSIRPTDKLYANGILPTVGTILMGDLIQTLVMGNVDAAGSRNDVVGYFLVSRARSY